MKKVPQVGNDIFDLRIALSISEKRSSRSVEFQTFELKKSYHNFQK